MKDGSEIDPRFYPLIERGLVVKVPSFVSDADANKMYVDMDRLLEQLFELLVSNIDNVEYRDVIRVEISRRI